MKAMSDSEVQKLQAKIAECDSAISAWTQIRAKAQSDLQALQKQGQGLRLPSRGTHGDRALRLSRTVDVDPAHVAHALGITYQVAIATLREMVRRDLMYQPIRGRYRTRELVARALTP